MERQAQGTVDVGSGSDSWTQREVGLRIAQLPSPLHNPTCQMMLQLFVTSGAPVYRCV